ncbi:rod shape-determining protein MreD [Caldovatus aquaticus]|uniref:Rod shape-determining protein MreD n=1 Tax=Caldovatus aquaticus TaxID=2865671 RepID=A0ABS7F199_9PROT|nr:rod shape-determining protein MreD [Caldovatus aquaticus]MBW8268581.1 rod shape-determining protein MreD [Caldovatus aquaticus]
MTRSGPPGGVAPARPAPPGRKEPPPGLLHRLDALGRATLPGAATALLMVLAAAPAGPPGAVAAVCLPAVFFWSVFRPAVMPAPLVFVLGLLQDLLGLAPLGAGVLTLLLAHGAAVRWRRAIARQGFVVVWTLYGAVAAAAMALGWMLQLLLTLRLPPVVPAWHLFLLSTGLYPLLAWPMARLHQAMSRAEAAA